jgi:recombination protein RecR
VEAFERLPGIGPKTAQRLTYYLLHAPKEEAQALAEAAICFKGKDGDLFNLF